MKKETRILKRNSKAHNSKFRGAVFLERLGKESWTYIKTVVDIVHEPILILDEDLRVMAANEPFYNLFKVKVRETENKVVYELGNGQWNIPDLRKLLEDVLPKNTFFKGFEVTHKFPVIGRKIMILNGREIHCKDDPKLGPCPPIILLAMEDVTNMMDVAEMLARHRNEFETKMSEKTEQLESYIKELKKEMDKLKKKK